MQLQLIFIRFGAAYWHNYRDRVATFQMCAKYVVENVVLIFNTKITDVRQMYLSNLIYFPLYLQRRPQNSRIPMATLHRKIIFPIEANFQFNGFANILKASGYTVLRKILFLNFRISYIYENIYNRYMGAQRSIQPIYPPLVQGHAIITKTFFPRTSILELTYSPINMQ